MNPTGKRCTIRFGGHCAILFVILCIASHPSAWAQSAGTFASTGNMSISRAFASATLLANGQVLIVGGGSAEIYEPSTGTFTTIGDMPNRRGSPTATLLDDGRVLIVGGDSSGNVQTTNSAELYDPATRTFTATGSTATGQIGGWATLLHNGKVLIAGGYTTYDDTDTFRTIANPELYDPSTGTFSATGSFATTGRASFYVTGGPDISSITLLADGRVLIAAEPRSELYDPVSGMFSLTGVMLTPCSFGGRPEYIVGRTATLLKNGKVLLTGGEHEDCGRFANAELYDPATGTFTATGNMTRVRDNHTATLFPNGTVLIAGGETQDCDFRGFCIFSGTTASAESYDPSAGAFTAVGDMVVRRAGQTSTLLKNGKVLLAGGYVYAGIGIYLGSVASAELYNPTGVNHANYSPIGFTRDFNGDGEVDILRRDTAGNVSMGLMNGNTIASESFIASVSTGWSIVGSGDFNGDRRSDVIWRNEAGDVAIWLMDGTGVSSNSVVANIWTGWSIVGIGDFDGDGKADILWREASGDVVIWLMDGTRVKSYSVIGNVSTGWSIVGVGDFNGNGKADILWRDTDGNVAVWMMDGFSVVSFGNITKVPLEASIAGVEDFDGDGRADILWHDTAGNVSIWLMNAGNIINSCLIAKIWTSWTIAGSGDFNGDGNSDILWRDNSGHEVLWFMNGCVVTSYREIG